MLVRGRSARRGGTLGTSSSVPAPADWLVVLVVVTAVVTVSLLLHFITK